MSWLSSALKGDKTPLTPFVNIARAPVRIVTAVAKGDFKKAAGIALIPSASSDETRNRVLRRAGGVLSGAAGGFITGGPAGALAGGIYGGIKAKKGAGQLKDYLGSFGTSLAIGGAAGGAAGLAGFGQYGGAAGSWTSGLLSKAPAEMSTVDYINSVQLRSSAPGGSLWSTAGKIGTAALTAGPSILSQLTQPGYQADQVEQTYPDGMFEGGEQPFSNPAMSAISRRRGFSQGTGSAGKDDSSGLLMAGLLIAGVLLWR